MFNKQIQLSYSNFNALFHFLKYSAFESHSNHTAFKVNNEQNIELSLFGTILFIPVENKGRTIFF